MTDEKHDVAVIGAGPAGVTAAILLARKNHRVVLVDAASFPKKTVSAGWLNSRAAPLLALMGVPIRSLLNHAFRKITFHNADFTKNARPAIKDAPGYLIDRTELDNALVETAVSAGIRWCPGCEIADVQLRESAVQLRTADGVSLTSRLLILASGRGGALLPRIGFGRHARKKIGCTAQVDASLAGKDSVSEPSVAVIFGLDRSISFGMCCVSRERMSITLNWSGDPSDATPALVGICRMAREHGLVPLDLSELASRAPSVPNPASIALEMDTHVGKHTLVIGDAGGFLAAASNEGLYPAMWSGQIAAEVMDRALAARHSQDELMTFDSQWRIQMADYLRAPHTDLQFLLPLIFSNQPMADRMATAFFSGENI